MPDDEAVIRDLKAQWLEAQMLHAPRDQHAKRLDGAAAREGVEHRSIEALFEKVFHNMLHNHVKRAGAWRFSVKLAALHGRERSTAFQGLEAVRGDEKGAARNIEPVV